MNHEAEDAPLVPSDFQIKVEEEEKPKTESVNKLLLKNTAQAFSPGYMLTKQICVFSGTIRKSIEQYRNKEKISFLRNFTKSIEEFDGVSYSDSLEKDDSLTSKGFKYIGKTISRLRGNAQQQNQQQNRNESLIPEQSQRIDEEQVQI